jgi:steroid 5-alpha reductase family enzyme
MARAGELGVVVLAVWVGMVVVMAVGWAFQALAKNGGWTDVFWTFGSGLCLAGAALATWPQWTPPVPRQWAVAALVGVWALRLGSYIAGRVSHGPEDARYAAFRKEWAPHFQRGMFFFLQAQAPATAILAVSIVLASREPSPGWRVQDIAGFILLAVSILGESLADGQMRRFRADPANKGKVCERGLWAWSRHPNYFFEWLVWIAYPVIAMEPAHPLTWLSFAAPLMMYFLLTKVSGVPPLEKAMLASRGDLFRDYQSRVSVFFPFPPKRPQPQGKPAS